MVSDMKLELYRTLTQVLVRDILPTNIEEVRVVQLPSELSHDGPPEAQKSPGSSVAPGTPTTPTTPGAHVLPAVTTMSPEQRIAVMKTVAEGSISVDEAVEVVLETERENRVRPPDEMVRGPPAIASHRVLQRAPGSPYPAVYWRRPSQGPVPRRGVTWGRR